MIYRHLVRPWLFQKDAEDAHIWVLRRMAQWRIGTVVCESLLTVNDPRLRVRVLGLEFRNPVGLAAGMDKHGEASAVWQRLGFGFFEIGTVTPEPQDGNPRPRMFRLPQDRAIINRLGFNSIGAAAVRENLARAPVNAIPMGINVGKNRHTPNEGASADYLRVMETLQAFADYFMINVSSPNTAGLRDLQQPAKVHTLVQEAVEMAGRVAPAVDRRPAPVLVKLAPDFEGGELEETAEAALSGGAAGFVATNTTVSREGLTACPQVREVGGLSGSPLRQRANEIVRRIFRCTRGSVPIIGVGGIFTAEDAYERIRAGASLVQVYTGLVYEGPGLVWRINRGLLHLLSQDGLPSIAAAIGRDCE